MKVKEGSAWVRVMKNGVVHHYTEAEYLAEFGHKPIKPTDGEGLFGGRYSNSTFKLSKEGTKWDSLTDDVRLTNTGSFDLNQEDHTV
tara:strand:- start:650 stop:910 length:261 start_codon:yes stop_codon:yes gene_type:complete